LQPLYERSDDTATWNVELARYAGLTWLELPWYFAETFFYRKLLEAVRYLPAGAWCAVDPFGPQKRRQEAEALASLAASWDQLASLEPGLRFETLLHSALWGNRADLSNLTVKEQALAGLAAQDERHLLLIDHTAQVHALLARGIKRVDFINDNVGLDSLFDLALADFLLSQGWAQQVVMHLKDRPFFVSDAMPHDIERVLASMARGASPSLRGLAARLAAAQTDGQLLLKTDPFWTSFQMLRDLPAGAAGRYRPCRAGHREGRRQLPPAAGRSRLACHNAHGGDNRLLPHCFRRPAHAQERDHGWLGRGPGGAAQR
jgi:hypothetical protein